MPRTTRNTERGQTLVLVAFSLIVLIGLVGLAVDGGRLFWERRTLQNAVDSAALAASDNYQDSQSISSSLQAAAREYAANESIYGASSASPSWSATTVDVTWVGAPDDMHVVYTSAGSVSAFDVSSTHRVGLAFMVVLGAGATAGVSATAQGHAKTGGTINAALATLSQGNCRGGGDSLSVVGNGDILVPGGSVQSSGSVSLGGRRAAISAGSFSVNCTSPVPSGITASNGTFTGIAPLSDPAFSPGPLGSYSSAQSASSNIVLQPGVYAGDPSTGPAGCYFLAGGVYTLQAGLGGGNFISNELRPPDEPDTSSGTPNYDNRVANPQEWSASGCSGSFILSTQISGLGLTGGVFGIVVTSTRTDYYPPQAQGGTAYPRESAPSTCHPIVVAAGRAINMVINNVPGAQGYNIYASYVASGDPCATGPWGFVASVPNTFIEIAGSLGTTLASINSSSLATLPTPANIGRACTVGSPYPPLCSAATGLTGSANPPGNGGETAPYVSGLAPSVPSKDTAANGGGDRADEHYNDPAVSPGAVQLYFPNTACISMTVGTVAVFGGPQYNWIVIFSPPSNNCSPSFSGHAVLASVGTVYWPAGNMSITGNGGAPVASQVIVNTFSAAGNGDLTIFYDPGSAPQQGYSQISM